jgi:hypothetical protein
VVTTFRGKGCKVKKLRKKKNGASSPGPRKSAEAFIRNPLHRDFKRVVRSDLDDITGFYLDDELRSRLAKMRRIPRTWTFCLWLLKSLLRKLTPVRRTLLVISLICLGLGEVSLDRGSVHITFNFYLPSILILLWIVMLELKDKLVVREEMEVGRAVQLALLPERNPEVPGWRIWLVSRPANDVGGDLADYLLLDGSRVGLSLGDVVGKGLGAALLMAKLQATLRAIAPDCGSLAELGTRTNRIFCRDCGPGRFATLIYVELAEDSNTLRILNAGHPSPVVVKATGVQMPPSVSLPIGVAPEANYIEQRLELAPGELAVLYSDGVTEASNREGAFFGEERLHELLPALRNLRAEEVGLRIIEEVERFVGDARPSDDVSLIVLQRV